MAINPREAAKLTDQAITSELAEAEQRLDRTLSRSYSTGSRVEVQSSDLPRDRFVLEALLKLYRKAGWKIEHYTGGQREPANYYIFTAK